ncbi:MAG: response regulator transcription factor [Elusimicrobia bacterium]|nr:response regulator transcription factor [Elusimicrobiota bacterium]
MRQLTLLIVEDDILNSEIVKTAFQEDGHIVNCAASLGECRDELEKNKPEVIILDRGLPDGDGFQLCLTLKKDPRFKAIPIVILTGRADVREKILGLRFGADDYLTKPFAIEELRARVGAVVRRVYGGAETAVSLCGITMDFKAITVTVKGRPLLLTNREFELLRVFMESPNNVFSRDSLIAAVWHNAVLTGSKVVDVTVMNLRRKLGGAGSPICAVRSLGYKFRSEG